MRFFILADIDVGTCQAHQAKEIIRMFFAKFFFGDRKSTRLNSSHANISYAVFCLKKKKKKQKHTQPRASTRPSNTRSNTRTLLSQQKTTRHFSLRNTTRCRNVVRNNSSISTSNSI